MDRWNRTETMSLRSHLLLMAKYNDWMNAKLYEPAAP